MCSRGRRRPRCSSWCAAEDDDGDRAARVIEQFLGALPANEAQLTVRVGELPADYPADVPRYDGGELIASVRADSPDGLSILAVYETSEPPGEALQDIERALAGDGWVITSATLLPDGGGIQFEDGARGGIVTVIEPPNASDDAPYVLTISVFDQDAGSQPEPDTGEEPYVAGPSLPLPAGFPEGRVPLYEGATIIGTTYAQVDGGVVFELRLVTPDAQEDVIAFYERELGDAGWDTDQPIEDASSIEMAFGGSPGGSFGAIGAAVFLSEISLTEIRVQVSLADGDR